VNEKRDKELEKKAELRNKKDEAIKNKIVALEESFNSVVL
jgi:hypothetical protein